MPDLKNTDPTSTTRDLGREDSPSARTTVGTYLAAIGAAAVGLVIALVDQTALHGLDRHLHAVYDPVGKYGEPTPLYIYLYSVGAFGVLSGLFCLRLLRRGSAWSRKVGITVLVLAVLVVAPLFLREYGQAVFPIQLSVFPAAACLFALIGVVAHPRRRGQHDHAS